MLTVLVGLIGLCIGSFLNVLIDRLPHGQTVTWDRSKCDHCRKPLRWFELIPVLSYVALGARCLRCRKPLKAQYPAIELITAGGFVWIWFAYGSNPLAFLALILVFSAFLVTLLVDVRHQIIPDSMTLLAFAGAILWTVQGRSGGTWIMHVLAGIGACGFLYLVWALSRGRGMGFGDVKFAFALGMLLGYPGTIIALYVGFLTGAILGVILIMAKAKTLKSRIAFGPFLILGAVVAFLWGNPIYAWWIQML